MSVRYRTCPETSGPCSTDYTAGTAGVEGAPQASQYRPKRSGVQGRRPVRVAHVVSHPIQYFTPLYCELAHRPELDLTVFFYSDVTAGTFHDPGFDREIAWDKSLLEGYRSVVTRAAHGAPANASLRYRVNLGVVRAVAAGRFDVVWAHGYSFVTTWLAVAAAGVRGSKTLIRDDATLLVQPPLARRLVKEFALRLLFSRAGGLYIGQENRRFLERYGIPSHRLFPARYCVDVREFQSREMQLRPTRDALRRKLGVPGESPVVVFVGKLYDVKQPLRLIEAFARVCRRTPCRLLIVGDGVARSDAEALAQRLGVKDAVLFAGFLNQSDVHEAYVAADLLVLPSRAETWGLVVNEALTLGLPVIVTDKVGCAADLVRDGWNGYVVDADSADELATAMERLVSNSDLRHTFGERGREIGSAYTIEASADEIVAACLTVTRGAGV